MGEKFKKCGGQGGLVCCNSWGHKESDTTEWLNWTELNSLVVFPTFFNTSLNLAIRSLWSEPQSAPGLVFADCIEFSTFGCKDYNLSDFGIDYLMMSMYRVFSCVFGRRCFLCPVCSLDKTLLNLCPASFCTPRPNLPITPGTSWLPTFAFQPLVMKKDICFWC